MRWDFDDGTIITTSGVTASHSYTSPGDFHPHAYLMAGSAYVNHSPGALAAANGYVYFPDKVSVAENAGQAQVRVHTQFAPTTVDYFTLDPDYHNSGRFTPVQGTLSFGPGEYDKYITVPVIDDAIFDGDSGFSIELKNPTNGVILGNATFLNGYPWAIGVVIQDDEPPPTFDFAGTFPMNASEADGTFSVTVVRSGDLLRTVSVDWSNDGLAATGTLTFNPGETQKTFSLPIPHDAVWSPPRRHTLGLARATNGGIIAGPNPLFKAAEWIVFDDLPSPVFTIGNVSQAEGDGGITIMTFPITLNVPLADAADVWAFTQNGSALAGSDYEAVPQTKVTFQPGELAKTFGVQIYGDGLLEADETFSINAGVAFPAHDNYLAWVTVVPGTGTIVNDDAPHIPVLVTSVTPAQGPAGGGTAVTLTGQSLSPDCVVSFGGTPAATLNYVSPTSLVATSPAHSGGAVELTITCGGEHVTIANGFTFLVPAHRRAAAH